jgi:dihydrofolate reductase
MIAATGAVVMGRNAYEMAKGDFTGYEYQVPLFVLTHEAPKLVAKGANRCLSFTFVTQGVSRAIELAKHAAGKRRVTVIGGPSTFQQCIAADVADELLVRVMPLLLSKGLKLFGEGVVPKRLLSAVSVEGLTTRTDHRFRLDNGHVWHEPSDT